MIRIRNEPNLLIVEGIDKAGRSALDQPLHRIFFRSNLKGSPPESNESWNIPTGAHPVIPLQQITQHLAKYDIVYSLDPACTKIIAEREKQSDEFKEMLKRALKAKSLIEPTSALQIERTLLHGFGRKLTELQLAAVNHLVIVHHGANFSVPGSGKTAIALAYYHMLRTQGEIDAFLVVGPASCFEPWEHEFELCFGSKPTNARIAGNTKTRRRELYLTAERYEFLQTTYHSAARDVSDLVRVLLDVATFSFSMSLIT